MVAPSEQAPQPAANNSPTTISTESASSDQHKTSQLSSLIASASAQYAQKRYQAAAETYAQAVEVQDEVNGEMSPSNADLFHAYGRCLFHIAMSKSDVLGVKVASDEPAERPRKKAKTETNVNGRASAAASGSADGVCKLGEEVIERAVEEKDGMKSELKEEDNLENKPYFQFKGDENFDDSDEDTQEAEGQDANGEEAAEEAEQDDFAYAYEILDIARVLHVRKLEALSSGENNSYRDDEPPKLRSTNEHLADIYDLQAEISLENERFTDAVNDLRSALSITQEYEPQDSKLLAELHYKLALALEFASLTRGKDSDADGGAEKVQVDEAIREEAAKEMELAIKSCKLRIQIEDDNLKGLEHKAAEAARKAVNEVRSICEDMEQRLADLRAPFQVPTALDQADPALRGILGSILGESPAQQKARIEEATRNANDLTGLVKHKRKAKPVDASDGSGDVKEHGVAANGDGMGKGKRKAEDGVADGGGEVDGGKRARVEDA